MFIITVIVATVIIITMKGTSNISKSGVKIAIEMSVCVHVLCLV